MRRTMRVLAILSILASSVLFAHSASAIGTLYSSSIGSGDVTCSDGGYFTILDRVVTGTTDCNGSVTIPTGVVSIAANAFSHTSIVAVTIPNGVTGIGNFAFENARYLASVTIPDSVTELGIGVFKGDYNLITASLGSGISTIPASAFWGATELTSIALPNSVTRINDQAFYNTARLTSITIPNRVTYIGTSAFSHNRGDDSGLTSVTVPNSVTEIGPYAFKSLRRLTSVILGSGLTAINAETFAGTAITSITIPNGVQSIASNAFSSTSLLSSFSYCGNSLTQQALTDAGLGGDMSRLACQAVITAGSEPNSQLVTFPAGVTVAEISASISLPAIKLSFGATAPEAVTVIPMTNPAPLSATPFMTSGSPKIVDIRIANHDGSAVTVCLEGSSTDRLYHYTRGVWVELDGQSFVNGQVCGVTNSFSPFTAAPAKPITTSNSAAEAAAAIAAAAKREAEKRDARAEILRRYKGSEAVTVETYQRAEIAGITSSNINEFNKEILRLPIEERSDLAEISKVARKYEVVGLIGSDRVKSVYPNQYVEVGLISADSKIKSTLAKAVRGLAENERSSYEAIKVAIEAKTAELQARKDRLAKVLARSSTRSGK
jgi:hypothetical protein